VPTLERGLKGIEPLIPPWYDGLELPVTDLVDVLDWILPRYAEKMKSEHGKGLLKDWQVWRAELEQTADSEGLLHL
jgi:hypothetical protein